jgi:hypothetical protein
MGPFSLLPRNAPSGTSLTSRTGTVSSRHSRTRAMFSSWLTAGLTSPSRRQKVDLQPGGQLQHADFLVVDGQWVGHAAHGQMGCQELILVLASQSRRLQGLELRGKDSTGFTLGIDKRLDAHGVTGQQQASARAGAGAANQPRRAPFIRP